MGRSPPDTARRRDAAEGLALERSAALSLHPNYVRVLDLIDLGRYHPGALPFEPLDAANDAIARARALAFAAANTPPSILRDDLRRLAIVMAVTALDAYLHRRVYESAAPSEKLTSGLVKLRVSFNDLAEIANATVAARAKKKPITDRPWVRVKNVLYDRLLQITFQSSQQVTDALGMVGVSDGWTKIAAAIGGGAKAKDLIAELDRIIRGRNQVVHEGDFTKQYRPQKVKRNSVSQADTATAIDFIEALIVAIDGIT